MRIGVVGISHHEAPVEIRDAFAFTQTLKIKLVNQLLDVGIEEVVVLGTCNRSEIYFATSEVTYEELSTVDFVKLQMIDFFHAQKYVQHVFVKEQEEALTHLFRVSAGLDSVVIGEDQILGQVKDALELAGELGSRKKFLSRSFLEAITFAKKMKHQYKISEKPLSIPSVAVKMLSEKHLVPWSQTKALVIGTGEMGQLTLKYLEEAGATQLFLCNRSACIPEPLQKSGKNYTLIPYDQRYEALVDMDVVVTTTSSPHLILKEVHFLPRTKPVYLIDMALPMDIERSIAHLPQVTLLDIDDIEAQTDANYELRQQIAKEMAAQVEEHVQGLMTWIQKTQVDPLIASFHELCDQSKQDTMALIAKKMTLNARDYAFLDKMVESAIKRVVRSPIQQLKTLEHVDEIEQYKKMIHKLFDL